MMDPLLLKRVLEAVLMAAAQPLSLAQLAGLFTEEEGVDNEQLLVALTALADDCAERGIELKEVASGYRYQIREDVHAWVTRLWTERQTKYSRALLETLALIAYRQPITRAEIEQIRGVAVSSSIIKTLEEREWVRVVGYRDVPGRPALFGTSRMFLDYFSLRSLDELPPLAEIRDLDEYDPQLDLAPVIPPSLELPPEDIEAAETEAAAARAEAEPEGDGQAEAADTGEPPVEAVTAEATAGEQVTEPADIDADSIDATAESSAADRHDGDGDDAAREAGTPDSDGTGKTAASAEADDHTAEADTGDQSAATDPDAPAGEEIRKATGHEDLSSPAWPDADDNVPDTDTDDSSVLAADDDIYPDSDAADDFPPEGDDADPADTTTSDDVPEHNA